MPIMDKERPARTPPPAAWKSSPPSRNTKPSRREAQSSTTKSAGAPTATSSTLMNARTSVKTRSDRSPARPRSRRRWLRTCLWIAVIGLTGYFAWRPVQGLFRGVPTGHALPAPVGDAHADDERFAAPGMVQAAGGALGLNFQIPGRIVEMPVGEGDMVDAGQVLAKLDPADAQTRIDAATAAVAAAQAECDRLTATLDEQIAASRQTAAQLEHAYLQVKDGARVEDIAAQAAVLKAAELEASRLDSRWQRNKDAGQVTVQDQTDMQKAAERAQQQVAVERARLERLQHGATTEVTQQAEAAWQAALANGREQTAAKPFLLERAHQELLQRQADLAAARQVLDKTVLRAPKAGTILWQFRHCGENVAPNAPQPVLTLADLSHLEVRAEVDEADFPRVFAGQPVEIHCDAYRDQVFTGHVLRLNRAAGQKRFLTGEAGERMDVRVVEAVIQLDRPQAFVINQRVTAYFTGRRPAEPASTTPVQEP